MKITTLLENTTKRADLSAEHGLSLYIETGGRRILFDMGQTDLFVENAKTLGIDLSTVDLAVLSHGHYDHGGGLRKFLEINDRAPVYMSQYAFFPHYNGTEKYIGLDVSLSDDPRIVFTGDTHRIDASLCLFSCNDRERNYPLNPFGLTEKTGDSLIPDDFRHEQYLLVEEDGKRVLISGCSHKGILDIMDWFSPDVLVGGFHFSKMPLGEELEEMAKTLARYPTVFYTCHCTGTAQLEFMKRYMPDLHGLSCGKHIIL